MTFGFKRLWKDIKEGATVVIYIISMWQEQRKKKLPK